MVHELREEGRSIRPYDQLVVLGAEAGRDLARQIDLAVARLLEADREGADRLDPELVHERDDRAGVEPAGEEDAERHVAHQVALDRRTDRVSELLLPLRRASQSARANMPSSRPTASTPSSS